MPGTLLGSGDRSVNKTDKNIELSILVECQETINNNSRDFPGGPVAKTLPFQCRGPMLDPWSCRN